MPKSGSFGGQNQGFFGDKIGGKTRKNPESSKIGNFREFSGNFGKFREIRVFGAPLGKSSNPSVNGSSEIWELVPLSAHQIPIGN